MRNSATALLRTPGNVNKKWTDLIYLSTHDLNSDLFGEGAAATRTPVFQG